MAAVTSSGVWVISDVSPMYVTGRAVLPVRLAVAVSPAAAKLLFPPGSSTVVPLVPTFTTFPVSP